jgi:hypothetical protein
MTGPLDELASGAERIVMQGAGPGRARRGVTRLDV